jgi:solute carrier family 25 carnitine/acylcarnitine transporter 20/29
MQTDSLSNDPTQRKYRNMGDAFRKLWAEGGTERFSRGFTACVLRSVPANAVLLTTAFRVKEIGYAWLDESGRR